MTKMTRRTTLALTGLAATAWMAGCSCPFRCGEKVATRVAALKGEVWQASEWISVKDAPLADTAKMSPHAKLRAADGTSRFCREITNEKKVTRAVWMTAGLGVYELFVNGQRVGGADALKPGFTHAEKTKRSFTYDVTALLNTGADAKNLFAAEVSAGWWRDKIVNFKGRKSAFRGVVAFTYSDGSTALVGTKAAEWAGAVGGPVTHAAIFDGEEYDARLERDFAPDGFTAGGCERNDEFKGEILPSEGGEICRRCDRALKPVTAYAWKGVTGDDAAKKIFGTVVKTRTFADAEPITVEPGETVVVDFGQNAAAVPSFAFSADEGTVLTCLPAEMLNDGNGERSRGNDGPAGSVYRENLRCPAEGMRCVYTFGKNDGRTVRYFPRYTFFGYRYVSLTATAPVTIACLKSVPVTSIRPELELGSIETGEKDVNRLIANVYWGQLSNYLSVPTDCPQRNERLGWTADTQVFAEAGSFNADTSAFFRKWMRDMVDSQDSRGGFPGVAPAAQYGNEPMRLGWADAGVIVPYQVWKQFGDTEIVNANWDAMAKYVGRVNETKYAMKAVAAENKNYQWADWLSFERFENTGGAGKPEFDAFEPVPGGKGRRPKAATLVYWDYLGACYWMWDAQMMAEMAAGTGRAAEAVKYRAMVAAAKDHLKKTFFNTPDGLILKDYRDMQTPALFALKLGLVEGTAKDATIAALRDNVKRNNGCLTTGFLGTSILMDTLTENGMVDVAYDLLLNHNFPGWLYSVDQGATTIWERWNSYTKEKGFGPVGMNSFNHYAYGAVLAWIYKTAAGIAADPAEPAFKRIVMAPKPDRRLGYVKASYKTPQGVVTSEWRYAGQGCVWSFTVPKGSVALVTKPGETKVETFRPGSYTFMLKVK